MWRAKSTIVPGTAPPSEITPPTHLGPGQHFCTSSGAHMTRNDPKETTYRQSMTHFSSDVGWPPESVQSPAWNSTTTSPRSFRRRGVDLRLRRFTLPYGAGFFRPTSTNASIEEAGRQGCCGLDRSTHTDRCEVPACAESTVLAPIGLSELMTAHRSVRATCAYPVAMEWDIQSDQHS